MLWTRPLVFGALLAALLGLALAGTLGWQNEKWQPELGESQTVGHGTPYSVRLDAFHMPHEQVRQHESRSSITWLEDQVTTGSDVASFGRPASLQGIAVRQVDLVPALKVSGRDAQGKALALQTGGEELAALSQVEVTFTSPDARRFIFISGHDLILALTLDPSQMATGTALRVDLLANDPVELEASDEDQEPLAILHDSGSLAVDELQLDLEFHFRPVLRADYRPGMVLVVAGMAVAAVALALGWLVPARWVWIAVEVGLAEESVIWIQALPGAKGSRWLSQLLDRLSEAVQESSPQAVADDD
jgi:hypothetical protein